MSAMFFSFLDAKCRLDEAVKCNIEASQKVVEALANHGSKLKKLRIKPKKPLH